MKLVKNGDRWEFANSPDGWLGWLNLEGSWKTALDAAAELSELHPEADVFFCSVREYLQGNGKGERTRFFGRSYDRRCYLIPDATLPDRQVHACKTPPKLAVDIGATLS